MPDAGTNVLKNSEYIDTTLGFEFKKAFFGIWLSNNPIQKNKLSHSLVLRRSCPHPRHGY